MRGFRTLFAVSAVIAIVAVAVAPTPVSAERPYKWKLTCRGPATFTATADWFWTVNGSMVAGSEMTATCADGSTIAGTGNRPADANDFTITLTVDDTSDGMPPVSSSVTQTFDAAHHFGLRFRASVLNSGTAVFAVNSWPA